MGGFFSFGLSCLHCMVLSSNISNSSSNNQPLNNKSTNTLNDMDLLNCIPMVDSCLGEPQSPYSPVFWPGWNAQSPMAYSPNSPCPSPKYHPTHHTTPSYPQIQQQKNPQRFQFIDQTPTNMPDTNIKRQQNIRPVERSIDQEKSRLAQQRRRDRRGKFLRNEVANRLEELEKQLEEKELVCDSLRNTLNQRDVELESLKQHFQQLMSQRAAGGYTHYAHHPAQFAQVPQSVCTTNRNYVLVPSPNPAVIHNRKPFMEKIDYTKVPLRKTEQLDEEKREVISSQVEWEERQRLQEFLAKMEQQARWQQLQFQSLSEQSPAPYYGGAPSNIYPETQNKIGNLPVPAFKTKVDFSNMRQALKKEEGQKKRNDYRSLQQLLLDDQIDLTEEQARILSENDDLFRRNISSPSLSNSNDFWNSVTANEEMNGKTANDDMDTSSLPTPSDVDQAQIEYPEQSDNVTISPRTQRLLGGPPSNIYPPPEKIGNLQVPAFTTKIDYSEVPLRRTAGQ